MPNIAPRTNRSTLIEDILLPLANAAFVALAFYSVLQDSGHHALLPWLMIVLAAIYLGFMRLPQSRTASAIHLSLAIVLLTIAVPLKASGHWITVSWLVEGLALLWVATRLAPAAPLPDPSDAYASRTLRWLASAALLLGFCGIFVHSMWSGWAAAPSFFSADTATSLIGVAVFATAAWLALRAGGDAAVQLVELAEDCHYRVHRHRPHRRAADAARASPLVVYVRSACAFSVSRLCYGSDGSGSLCGSGCGLASTGARAS